MRAMGSFSTPAGTTGRRSCLDGSVGAPMGFAFRLVGLFGVEAMRKGRGEVRHRGQDEEQSEADEAAPVQGREGNQQHQHLAYGADDEQVLDHELSRSDGLPRLGCAGAAGVCHAAITSSAAATVSRCCSWISDSSGVEA